MRDRCSSKAVKAALLIFLFDLRPETLQLQDYSLHSWSWMRGRCSRKSKSKWNLLLIVFICFGSPGKPGTFANKKNPTRKCWIFLVGMTGFEPATTRPPGVYATGLRYIPMLLSSIYLFIPLPFISFSNWIASLLLAHAHSSTKLHGIPFDVYVLLPVLCLFKRSLILLVWPT